LHEAGLVEIRFDSRPSKLPARQGPLHYASVGDRCFISRLPSGHRIALSQAGGGARASAGSGENNATENASRGNTNAGAADEDQKLLQAAAATGRLSGVVLARADGLTLSKPPPLATRINTPRRRIVATHSWASIARLISFS